MRQLDWSETTGDMVGSTLSELLVEIQISSRWEDAGSAAHWEYVGGPSSCRVWRGTQHSYRSRYDAKDAWPAMRRE